jgi:hypothetical protein
LGSNIVGPACSREGPTAKKRPRDAREVTADARNQPAADAIDVSLRAKSFYGDCSNNSTDATSFATNAITSSSDNKYSCELLSDLVLSFITMT